MIKAFRVQGLRVQKLRIEQYLVELAVWSMEKIHTQRIPKH